MKRRLKKPALVLVILLLIASIVFTVSIVGRNIKSNEELAYKNTKSFIYEDNDNIEFMIDYTNDRTLNKTLEENIDIIFEENKNVFENKNKKIKVILSLNNDKKLVSWLFTEETDNLSEVYGSLIFNSETNEVIIKEKIFSEDLRGLSMLVREKLAQDEILRYNKKTYTKTTPKLKNYKNIMLDHDQVSILFKRDHFDIDNVTEVKLDYTQIMPYFSEVFLEFFDSEYIKPEVVDSRYIDPNKQMVALTFDDGPNYDKSREIASHYANNNSRVTYFWLGSRMATDPEIVLELHNLGHEIANHSFDHKNYTVIEDKELIRQVADVTKQIKDITKQEQVLLRPPYGITNEEIRTKIGSPLIMWDIDPSDWRIHNVRAILDNIEANISDGSIILLHDLYDESIKASKVLLDEFKDSYQFVTVSEMFAYKGIPLINGELYYNAKGR